MGWAHAGIWNNQASGAGSKAVKQSVGRYGGGAGSCRQAAVKVV